MDELTNYALKVFQCVNGLITDNSEVVEKLYNAIEDSGATDEKKEELHGLCCVLYEKWFVDGFLQGAIWTRGGAA